MLLKVLNMTFSWVKSVLSDVKVEKYKCWNAGDSVYVRLTFSIRSDVSDGKSFFTKVLKFSKDGMILVSDWDPRFVDSSLAEREDQNA